ncbi:MAG: hypothetical protein FJY20_12535 [Bacteroidetes bacterium]|nr:hypothetical protein [Bacteroidota bacterium]
MTSLSDAAAESLGKHERSLELNGLTSLSDAAAESLAKHKGYLGLNDSMSERIDSKKQIIKS